MDSDSKRKHHKQQRSSDAAAANKKQHREGREQPYKATAEHWNEHTVDRVFRPSVDLPPFVTLPSPSSTMSSKVRCPYDPKAYLIEDHQAGDLICSKCGLVVGDRVIDVSAEWRNFSSNDKGSGTDACRVGEAENPLFQGLTTMSTTIGAAPGNASSSALTTNSFKRRPKAYDSKTKRLLDTFREITDMGEKLKCTRPTVDKANMLFKQASDKCGIRSKDVLAAACIYIACRQEAVPRTFKEVCAVSRVSKIEVGRAFKKITEKLQLAKATPITESGDLMSRFCTNLDVCHGTQKAATCIAEKARKLELVTGRNPASVTAAAIYMAVQAAGEHKTRKEVSEATGASEVALKGSYKLMLPRAAELFPDQFNFKVSIKQLAKC